MIRAKIFEKIAQNSLLQQNSLNEILREEREKITKESKNRVQKVENIVKQSSKVDDGEIKMNSKEIQSLTQELSQANSRIFTYKSQL